MDAIAKLEPIVGDDDLNDQLYQDSIDHGPDFDATGRIKDWLQSNMPEVMSQIDFGANNGRDAQTNFAPANSPQLAHGNEYGIDTMDKPVNTVNENDDLDFIRSLAGLRR
jgi:hypothetical protein